MRYLRHAEDIAFHEEVRSVQRSMTKRYANRMEKMGVSREHRDQSREEGKSEKGRKTYFINSSSETRCREMRRSCMEPA